MSKNIVMHDIDGNQIFPVTTSENVYVGAGVTLKEHLQNLADNVPGGTVIVDTELSEESENPVQNKVITKKLSDIDQSIIDAISNLETETETAISKVNTTATNALNMVYDINRLINRKVYYGVATYDSTQRTIDLTIPEYTTYDTGTLFFGDFENDIELTNNTAFSVNGSYLGEPGSLLPRQISAGLVAFTVKTVGRVPKVVFFDDFNRLDYFEQKLFKHDNKCEEISNHINTLLKPNIIKESVENVCPFSLNHGLAYMKTVGYTSQNGTPTPTGPIEVVGCGGSGTIDISLSKKNLFDKDNFEILKGYTFNDYGEVVASNWDIVNTYIPVKKSSNYVISGKVALANWGVAVVLYNSNKEIISRLRVVVSQSNTLSFETTEDTAYMRFNMYPTDANINTIQIEEGINATTYEKYQGMIVSIPIDSPLYEGDYIEIFEDGSGEVVRTMREYIVNDATTWISEPIKDTSKIRFSYSALSTNAKSFSNNAKCSAKCNRYVASTADATYLGSTDNIFAINTNGYLHVYSSEYDSIDEFRTHISSNPLKFVYELKTPTRTELTPHQVAEFKKLTTFEGTTHVNADGSVSIRYYADKVGMLEKELEELKTTLASLVTTNTEE